MASVAERRIVPMGEMQRQANSADTPKGIPCKNCGSTRRRVWTTRRGDGYVMRETICLECEAKRVTMER